MRLIPLFFLPFMFACASPQQACLTNATKDLAVIERLIAETDTNLARGYAVERQPGVQTGLELCVEPDDPFLFCTTQQLTVVERPIALDVVAERAKRAALLSKRAELTARTTAEATECRARFPEPAR